MIGRFIGVRIWDENEKFNFDMADNFCFEKFGTTLASIHP